MKKLILVLMIFTGIISFTTAQTYTQIHAGLAFPRGEFADSDEDNGMDEGSGHAAMGFNVGLKIFSPLKIDRLYMTYGIDIFYNDLNNDAKDDWFEDDDDVDYIIPKYINVPVMLGLNYSYPVQEGLNIYGEGSLGANFLKITNQKATFQNYEYTTKFNISAKLAYNFGIGIVFQDKYNVGLNYHGLGAHKCKYEYENSQGEKDTDKFENSLEIGILALTVGIKL